MDSMSTLEMDSLSDYVTTKLSAELNNLQDLWTTLGYEGEVYTTRVQTVWSHIQRLVHEMVCEEEGMKNKLVEEIESYLKEADQLKKELKVEIDMNCDITLPLKKVHALLFVKLQGFADIKAERLTVYEKLKICERELMESLGLPNSFVQIGHLPSVPSEEQLLSFQTYLDNNNAEKQRRHEHFLQTRSKVMAIMEEMELEPEWEFEKIVVLSPDKFKCTKENMNELKELHRSMETQLAAAKLLSSELREKLAILWERLNVSQELRTSFNDGYVGCSADTIEALNLEINRCELLKRENIKVFIQTVREELQLWWAKCLYSDEQKNEFHLFKSDVYTENLLELHEMEVARLKAWYLENKIIIERLEKWQNLWDRRVVLEDEANLPNRFGNRGGQLLMEEKERKTIGRDLPKIEKDLKKLVMAYSDEYNMPFLIFGQDLLTFLDEKWAEYEGKKEEMKLARKARQQNNITIVKSASKCTVGMSAKRKNQDAHAKDLTKRSRVEPTTEMSVRPVRGNSKYTATRTKQAKRRIFNKSRASVSPVDEENAEPTSPYREFAKSAFCRSSTKPEIKSRLCTPSKTPLRPLLSLARNTPAAQVAPMSLRTPKFTPSRIAGHTMKFTALGHVTRNTPVKSVASISKYTPKKANLPFLI